MSRNGKIFILGAVAVLMLASVIFSNGNFLGNTRSSQATDKKDPEVSGLSSVALDGTYKLNAALPPPQFFAVKNFLSVYIVERIDPGIRNASLQTTLLNPDGSITLDVAVPGHRSFSAKIHQAGNRLFFQVPASGPSDYQASRDLDSIEEAYKGGG